MARETENTGVQSGGKARIDGAAFASLLIISALADWTLTSDSDGMGTLRTPTMVTIAPLATLVEVI